MVVFVLIGAGVFALAFQCVGGREKIGSFLLNFTGGQAGFLVNAFVSILAIFSVSSRSSSLSCRCWCPRPSILASI